MSNYVVTTDFAAKDALPTGNPSKIATGTSVDTEFDNIAVAIATKEDTANKNIANGYAGLNASSQLANAQISAASVTQHQASLSIATSQLTGTLADARVAQSNVTQYQSALSIATSQLTGTLADARVAQSNVTQYQSALSIAWSQISGTKNADQLQGRTMAETATASAIVARTASGYAYATYFNQSSSSSENPTIGAVFVEASGDGFLRKTAYSAFKSDIFASAALTGNPTAPTAAAGTQTTQIATTAFVDPAHVISTNGYQKFSSGLIFQWGTGSFTSADAISFPLTFPNACLNVQAQPDEATTSNKFAWSVSDLSTSGFTMYNNGRTGGTFYWFAVGY